MSNFVLDGTSLPIGKIDGGPALPNPNAGISAFEWNTVCQALYDVRAVFGKIKRGSALFSNVDRVSVTFLHAYPDANYSIALLPSMLTSGGLPVVGFDNKTNTGFDIVLTDLFNGFVDWQTGPYIDLGV
jgi:hypothetical protein